MLRGEATASFIWIRDVMKKAQAAVEFVAYFGFFLTMFVLFLAYLSIQHSSDVKLYTQNAGKEMAGRVASEIHFAVSSGDGYNRTFVIPKTFMASKYSLNFTPQGFVEISWEGDAPFSYQFQTGVSALNTNTLIGAPGDLEVDVSLGRMTVENRNGAIYVQQY